jgi:hypothetical protein
MLLARQSRQNGRGVALEHATHRQRQSSDEGGVWQLTKAAVFQQFQLAHGHLERRRKNTNVHTRPFPRGAQERTS